MKPRKLALIIAGTLMAALAVTVHVAAQGNSDHNHHHYQFIDLGTLGGPNSYLPLLPPYHDFLPSASLSRNGTLAGFADTTTPDPYNPLCFNTDCFVSHAITWRNGKMTDLGALPGLAGSSSAATWISDKGLIAGVSENGEIDPLISGPAFLGVLWKDGMAINLGTLDGGYESQAMAVNNSGQVVGIASNLISYADSFLRKKTQARAFLWENGVLQDLGTLPGGTDAMALFINEPGQIVGQSYSANSTVPPAVGCNDSPLTLYAFIWQEGQMTDLGTLGGNCTFPYSLNNHGQVVGQSNLAGDITSHPFLWQREKMKDLGTLGGTYGFAEWLNDAGTVVGSATNDGDQALLAFRWEKTTMTNLGALPGNACSAADAINSAGQIVGGSGFYDAPYEPACTDPVEHAVLWDNGQIFDLNAFVPPGTDLTLTEAFFINDRGEISGIGTLSNGDQHTFLLIPCDENHPDVEGCNGLVDAVAPTPPSAAVIMHESTTQTPGALRSFGRRGFTLSTGQTGARTARSPIAQSTASNSQMAWSNTEAKLSPTNLTFGTVTIGTTSPAQAATLTNLGTTTLNITDIAITGTDAEDFAQTHTCGSLLAAGASCGITVMFKPTASGARTAALNVSDSPSASRPKVYLSGTGVAGRCTPEGHPCGPVRCCSGLACTFRGGSTRVGYACEPKGSENISTPTGTVNENLPNSAVQGLEEE